MQWLIDIAIEAIRNWLADNPCFVDRGDAADEDWLMPPLLADSAWHELDISGVVPLTATCVAFSLITVNANIGEHIAMRTLGNVITNNESFMNSMVAFMVQGDFFLCHPSEDGKVEYWIDAGGWAYVGLTVRGWWAR